LDSSGVHEITSSQATAFQITRQHLVRRERAEALDRILGDMNGAQAQLLSAAQLALWARSTVTRRSLGEAVWSRKTVVRAGCMRRTLHLLSAKDAAIYCLGSARRAEKEIRWMLSYGASRRGLERALEELLNLLDRPQSRAELAARLAQRLRVPVESRAGGIGWARPGRSRAPGPRSVAGGTVRNPTDPRRFFLPRRSIRASSRPRRPSPTSRADARPRDRRCNSAPPKLRTLA
jgi:hypothetical protein